MRSERTTGKGYGSFMVAGRRILTHRFAYELVFGPVPPGYELDHLCRVRSCCNPLHLEAVRHAENMRRARLTRCRAGHDLTRAYEYSGRRFCRECQARRNAAYHARKKGGR
jgi:hypothetical protein